MAELDRDPLEEGAEDQEITGPPQDSWLAHADADLDEDDETQGQPSDIADAGEGPDRS